MSLDEFVDSLTPEQIQFLLYLLDLNQSFDELYDSVCELLEALEKLSE